jgi:hypothetical protein
MSRSAGALNRRTESMLRAIDRAEGENLIDCLSHISQDDDLPLRMRMDACRMLGGSLYGKMRLHERTKKLAKEILANKGEIQHA